MWDSIYAVNSLSARSTTFSTVKPKWFSTSCAGPNQGEIWNRAQAGQMLDWLMGRAIFAEADRVMRKDVDDVQAHQRGEPNRRPTIVCEDHEARAERNQTAVQRDAVEDRAHPVLADAEMEIAADVIVALEIAAVLQVGEGRLVEVRGAAEQARYALPDNLLDAGSRLARSKRVLGGEDRQVAIPSVG